MCRKMFENRFTNKNSMSKMFLNRDFAKAREVNLKFLTLDSGKFCRLYSNVWTPGKLSLQFRVGFLNF